MHRYAGRLVGADAAEDVIQQAMLKAWSALDRGHEITDLRPWLYRIVQSVALDTLAREKRTGEALSDALVGAAGADSDAAQRALARSTLAGIATLPKRQREALLQTALHGRSGSEVAVALGISETAARQLVRRARTTLRASVSAITPVPLLEWAAETGGHPALSGATELGAASAGAGLASLAAKVGITVAVTAAAAGGVAQVLRTDPHNHALPAQAAMLQLHRNAVLIGRPTYRPQPPASKSNPATGTTAAASHRLSPSGAPSRVASGGRDAHQRATAGNTGSTGASQGIHGNKNAAVARAGQGTLTAGNLGAAGPSHSTAGNGIRSGAQARSVNRGSSGLNQPGLNADQLCQITGAC